MKRTFEPYEETPNTFRSQLEPLIFLTSIFFLTFVARIIPAPLLPAIEKDLGVTHAEAGSLFLFISLGYFITLLGSGFVSSRLMHRQTIVLSATTLGLALGAVVVGQRLWSIRIGLFFVGMAAGLYLPSGLATLTSLVHSKHWGKAIAIHEWAPNLSFVAAPLISEALLLWFSWRSILAMLGGISIIVGLAFARFGRGGLFPGQAPSFASFNTLFRERAFWIMIVLFSLGIGATLGIYTMLPLFLVSVHGMKRSLANTLIALSRVSGLFMAFLAGWANDRLGPQRTLVLVFLLTGTATMLLGGSSGFWILILVFIQPMLACCFFPPGFAALSSVGPQSTRNVAVSLTIPAAFIFGGGAIPSIIGFMGDTGSFSMGFVSVGLIISLGSVLARSLGLRPEKSPTHTYDLDRA